MHAVNWGSGSYRIGIALLGVHLSASIIVINLLTTNGRGDIRNYRTDQLK